MCFHLFAVDMWDLSARRVAAVTDLYRQYPVCFHRLQCLMVSFVVDKMTVSSNHSELENRRRVQK